MLEIADVGIDVKNITASNLLAFLCYDLQNFLITINVLHIAKRNSKLQITLKCVDIKLFVLCFFRL